MDASIDGLVENALAGPLYQTFDFCETCIATATLREPQPTLVVLLDWMGNIRIFPRLYVDC